MSNKGLRLLANTNPPQSPERHTYMRNTKHNCWANSVLFILKFTGVGGRRSDADFIPERQVQKTIIQLLQSNWARIKAPAMDQTINAIIKQFKVSGFSVYPTHNEDSATHFFDLITRGVPSCSPYWCSVLSCPDCEWSGPAQTKGNGPEIPIIVENRLRDKIQELVQASPLQNTLEIALQALFGGVPYIKARKDVKCAWCSSGQLRVKFAVLDKQLSDIIAIQGLQFENDYLDAGDVMVQVEGQGGTLEDARLRLVGMILHTPDPKHYLALIFHYQGTDQVVESSFLNPGMPPKPNGAIRIDRESTLKELRGAREDKLEHLFFFEKV